MKAGAALWRVLADGAEDLDTTPSWAARLGLDYASLGSLLVGTTEPARRWPCGLGRADCWRRIVEEDGGLIAVCTDQDWYCQLEPVRRADAWLHRLDHKAVIGAVRAGLALTSDGPSRLVPGTWWIGSREFGEVVIGFYLAMQAERSALDAVTADVDWDAVELVVLLVASEPDGDTSALAKARKIDVRQLPVMSELRAGGALGFDLDDLVLHHRFRGLEDPMPLLSDRIRLLLHPMGGKIWLDRQLLKMSSASKVPWAFLDALARRPDRDVPRSELLPIVYEDYRPENSGQGWEVKLRQAKSQLPRAQWPIEAVSGDFYSGGYRLNLAQHQIAWWSELPPKRGQNKAKRSSNSRSNRPGKAR